MKNFYRGEETYTRINGKIKSLSETQHFSQEKLAELTGLSRCQIPRIENEKAKYILWGSAIMLAKVLNVSVEELYEEE